ncbi:hypothetical protein RJ640_014105 [Escallonia rubra]|uniref:SNRNP25 ubiquitin-like domain-containing protein n=1 Tax=Escallonia rubra TaxID=112253 RepID=A0AA88RL52_9ASTE|nr:hypothetical protein RJ640_014105 [Escallonia rubra]
MLNQLQQNNGSDNHQKKTITIPIAAKTNWKNTMLALGMFPRKALARRIKSHVWGHFCLCYDGQKLLTDGDCIGSYGIKEGDQLQFIRHLSINYNMIKERPEKQVPDIEESRISDACKEGEQKIWDDDNYDDQENLTYEQDDDGDSDIITHCEYKLAHLLRGWFSYRRLTGSHMRFEQKSYSNSSRFSNVFGSFRNIVRLYSNKYNSRTETRKPE